MQKIVIQLLIFLFFLSLCIAAPFDSGWRIFTQPNAVTFTARHWGDEFQWWMRTEAGYGIVQNVDNYYYAVPDSTALDIRFSGDWLYTDSTGQIEITTDAYPLTIEYEIVNGDTGDWNLSSFGLPKSGRGIDDDLPEINHNLKKRGKIVIGKTLKTLLLNKVSSKNIPKKYALHQNYPNPFNSSTRIKYDLPRKTKVKIVIYDILGRKIKILVNRTEVAGYKNIVWNGQNDYGFTVASGMYFYRIETENFVKTRKLLVIK